MTSSEQVIILILKQLRQVDHHSCVLRENPGQRKDVICTPVIYSKNTRKNEKNIPVFKHNTCTIAILYFKHIHCTFSLDH